MGIKVFFSSILVLAAASYFLPVDNYKKDNEDKDIPLVVFEESTMYTLTEKSLNRVVNSSHAVRYKNRDEMLNANIILKNKNNDNYKSENLKAKQIVKKGNLLTLERDVQYYRDDFIDLKTEELFYNLETKVATNSLPYEGNYFGHFIKGEKLYLDATLNNMKSKNVHYEIDMKNKN